MSFKEICLSQGIKAFFLDLDDNLVHTNIIFLTQIELFCKHVADRYPGVTQDGFSKLVHEINNRLFVTNGVSPHSWDENCVELCQCYPDAVQYIKEGMVHIRQIYQTAPQWKNGTVEFLTTLKSEGIPTYIVTHADEDWTAIKVSTLGIAQYVTAIHVVPARAHKTAAEWTKALNRFGFLPEEVCVSGDSLKTDINPAYEAGVRRLIWMDYADSWHIYRTGIVPEGTLTIREVPEIIPLISSRPW